MLSILASSLLLASLTTTEVQDDGRIKVSAEVKDSNSPRSHADAQIRLMRMAKKACKGQGKAVSDGALHVNNVVPDGKTKSVLVISEYYRCSGA